MNTVYITGLKRMGVAAATGLLLACTHPAPPAVQVTNEGAGKNVPSKTMPAMNDEAFRQHQKMMRYEIKGKVYYLVYAACCDQFNPLLDAYGQYVCSPSGGFTGRGDGSCPELAEVIRQSEGRLVDNPFVMR